VKNFFKIFSFIILFSGLSLSTQAAEKVEYLKTDWSFKGLFGKFDRAALQRGYQVYTEVCSSCHSMKYLSYRNLAEKGGPEFSIEQAKAIAASFEVKDGPNSDGDMFTRPGRLSDKFVMPYDNVQAAQAANGGAYPPDMSVLVKARAGGADYIYSVLLGYVDPPENIKLDDGVYYNKYNAELDLPGILLNDSSLTDEINAEVVSVVYMKKQGFRINISPLTKQNAIRACEKIKALGQLCEISK